MSSIQIRNINILDTNTEIIVNAANNQLRYGGGVCGIVFRAAGVQQLQEACDKIGYCPTGSTVITPAFDMNAKYIIHAVGPMYRDGHQNEPQFLYSAYQSSLELAKQYDCHSISFPLISAGIFGYPLDDAWRKAIQACHDFINNNPNYPMDITFAVIDDYILTLGQETLKEIVG